MRETIMTSQTLKQIRTTEDALDTAEDLANRMEELSRALAKTDQGSRLLNLPLQEIAKWTGDDRYAQLLAKFETLDAQFATIAKPIEGLTAGSRIAVQNTQRALAFHAKAAEPFKVKMARISELKTVIRRLRSILHTQANREIERNALFMRGMGFGAYGDIGTRLGPQMEEREDEEGVTAE